MNHEKDNAPFTLHHSPLPEGYKQTDVGIIPEDWEVTDIEGLNPFVTSGSRGWAEFYSDRGSPFIRITNLSRKSIYLDLSDLKLVNLPSGINEGARTQLYSDDILISVTADIGIIGYINESVPKPAYINQHIALVRFDASKINTRFVSYFLASEKPQKLFRSSTDWGAKAGMSLLTVRKIQLALPPLPEQQAIAEVLSDVDALLTSLDQLIAKKRNIKQGTMQLLLTGKKRLPGFSSDWETKTLGEIFRLKGGFAFSSELFSSKGTILLTPGNFRLDGGLYFNERNTKRYCGGYKPQMGFNIGDLLIVMTDLTPDCNLLGKPAFVDIAETILHNQRIGKVEMIKKDISLNFLYYFFLSSSYLSKIKETATGSTVRHTSNKSIYDVSMPFPSTKEEQKAIAQILNDMDAEIESLETKREKYKAIKQGMMQELLTGKTRLV